MAKNERTDDGSRDPALLLALALAPCPSCLCAPAPLSRRRRLSRAARASTSASLKLLPLLVVYLVWVRTCWWVDQRRPASSSCRTRLWNPILLGCGVLGLLVVWLFPWFLAVASCPARPASSGRPWPTSTSATSRSPTSERVLTPRPPARAGRALPQAQARAKQEDGGEERSPSASSARASTGRTRTTRPRQPRRGARKGYKAALEMVYEAIAGAPPTSTWSRPRRR